MSTKSAPPPPRGDQTALQGTRRHLVPREYRPGARGSLLRPSVTARRDDSDNRGLLPWGLKGVVGLGSTPHDLKEVLQSMGEGGVDQLVADLAPLGVGEHQAAVAKAGKVIGHVLPGQTKPIGEPSRIVRSLEQGQQQAAPSGVGQCAPEALDGGEALLGGQHENHCTSFAV